MRKPVKESGDNAISRRQILRVLAAAGIAPALVEAQVPQSVSPEVLEVAQKLLDQGFSVETLERITPAVQRGMDTFEIVRLLEIDDLVEPAPVFRAEGK